MTRSAGSFRAELYNLLRRRLSQERRNRLKRRLAHSRNQLAPLYRLRYGTFTAAELREEVALRLAPDTEILMVHCSINDLEPMYSGTVTELLDALLELCGPGRTLVMPSFFFGGAESGIAEHYRRKPVFDARRQPSQMGLLSELFRRRTGVARSLHPTHSICALGPLSEELVDGHHNAQSTFGAGTPFTVMAQRKTAIVGIGTQYFRCLTQVHAAEDLLGERFPVALRRQSLPVELRDFHGQLHSFVLRVDHAGPTRRLEFLERLIGPKELIQWHFHGAPMFITSAARVTEALIEAALNGETIYESMPVTGAATRSAASASASA